MELGEVHDLGRLPVRKGCKPRFEIVSRDQSPSAVLLHFYATGRDLQVQSRQTDADCLGRLLRRVSKGFGHFHPLFLSLAFTDEPVVDQTEDTRPAKPPEGHQIVELQPFFR